MSHRSAGMFSRARAAEIVRSNQKDEYYISYIKNTVSDLSQTLLGPRSLLLWRQELDVIAEAGYFLLTTLSGNQTLGEEYVNIVEVDSSLRAIPSFWRRAVMALLQVVAPYLINRCLTWLEKQFQQNMSLNVTAEKRKAICDILAMCRHAVTLLHRCHLAVFYMTGIFYHIAKRIAGVHYILVRGGMDSAWTPNYRILGWLTIIQLLVTFMQQFYALWRQHKQQQTNHKTATESKMMSAAGRTSVGEGDVSASRKCALCWEERSYSTAPPCGHLYCWSCITDWAQLKPECPLCREKFDLAQLIYLKNFDP